MCQNDLFILCTLLKTELEWKRAKTAYPDFVRANEVEWKHTRTAYPDSVCASEKQSLQ